MKKSLCFGTFLVVLVGALEGWSAQTLQSPWLLPDPAHTKESQRLDGEDSLSRLLPDLADSTTFRLTGFTPLNPFLRLKDLRPDSEMPRTKGALSSSILFNGKLVGEGEIMNNVESSGSITGGDPSAQRMVRLALNGTSNKFRYGVHYRSAGKAFLHMPDQAMRELWGEWGQGIVRFRSSLSETWNNVDADSNRARIGQTQGRLRVAIAKPSWPEFSLTYARSRVASSLETVGASSLRNQSNMLEGALFYAGLKWNARLASSYGVTSDLIRPGSDTVTFAKILTGMYSPVSPVTIIPTLSYRADHQQWSGVRIDNPSAVLSLNYKQSQRLHLSVLGSYGSSTSSDGLIDTTSLNSKGVLTWSLQPSSPTSARVSMEAGYTRLANQTTPILDSEDLSGLVRLHLAPF